jgi:hypothetical protein
MIADLKKIVIAIVQETAGRSAAAMSQCPHLVLSLKRAALLQWLGVWVAVAESQSTTPAEQSMIGTC